MLCFPNGKLNIGLSVIEKRADGFHNIESVMIPVTMYDVLEIIIAHDGKTAFNISGFDIEGDLKSNLVLKAFDIISKQYKIPPLHIHLHKAIPSGAGLGGGSADAAEMVKMCNELFSLRLTEADMEDIVRPLGSDCAFFIRNNSALAFGRGDQLEMIHHDFKKLYLVVIKPPIHINTAKAYSWIKPSKKAKSLLNYFQLPTEQWKGLVVNDFEIPVFEHHPEIKTIRDELYHNGALYASLTGTGAAVFGIFKQAVDLKSAFPAYYHWIGKVIS